MSFEWETQEDISWDEPPPLEEEPIEPPQSGRRWPYLVLALLIGAGVAGLIIVRELNQRVAQAEAEARLAVISSYSVIQQAAAESDAELFVGFLSGRDEAWSQAHEEAVREGAFLDRSGLGLRRLEDENADAATADVNFSPDLLSAELTVTQTYAVDIGNDLTESVQFQQTAVYRLGPNRWLLSPPEAEFWGETLTSNGRYLVLTYPERDAEIGRRLALDLDRKLMEMCAQLSDLNCPSALQVTVDLATDPDSLLLFRDGSIPTGLSLSLPAPTLAGVPLDESGYRSLQRGYARWVVAAVISDLVGWTCCEHELIYQTLLDMEWQQLGLKTWPPLAYEQVIESARQLESMIELWDATTAAAQADEWQNSYALITFLTTEVGLSPTELQREMGDITYRNWLLNVMGEAYPSFTDLDRDWQRFLDERAFSHSEAVVSLPNQNLQLLCYPNAGTNLDLVRYVSAVDGFTAERHFSDSISMLGLPDDSGVFLSGPGLAEPMIWREGQAAILPRLADLPALAFDPLGEHLLLVDVLQAISPYLLLPLADCLTGTNCTRQSLVGYPVWSPNGSQVVMAGINLSNGSGQNDPFLFWANNRTGNNATLLREGALPFWLDETTVGFVSRGEVLSLLTLPEESVEVILLLEDLLTHLPSETGALNETFIDFVTADPHNPDQLLIATADEFGRLAHAHLFVYDWQTEQVFVPQYFRNERTDYERGYELSPDGRWLTMTRFDRDQSVWLLYLYDFAQKETTTITVDEAFDPSGPRLFDWSADGRWLVVTENGYLRLIELETGYEKLVAGKQIGCETAVWIN
jgi:hypothetical protein